MPSLPGLPEAPCARCGRHARIAWGELCPLCQNERMGRAVKVSRVVGIVLSLALGAWVTLRLPAEHRYFAAIAVIAIYVITRRIATMLAMEFLPKEWEKKSEK
ncbi:MAG: hypothetical protein AB7I33_12760 [Gemmatimonadales bacterium]